MNSHYFKTVLAILGDKNQRSLPQIVHLEFCHGLPVVDVNAPEMAESAVPVVVTEVVPEGPGSSNKTDQELLDDVKSTRNASSTQKKTGKN